MYMCMYVNYVSISEKFLVNSGIDEKLKAFPRLFEIISYNNSILLIINKTNSQWFKLNYAHVYAFRHLYTRPLHNIRLIDKCKLNDDQHDAQKLACLINRKQSETNKIQTPKQSSAN